MQHTIIVCKHTRQKKRRRQHVLNLCTAHYIKCARARFLTWIKCNVQSPCRHRVIFSCPVHHFILSKHKLTHSHTNTCAPGILSFYSAVGELHTEPRTNGRKEDNRMRDGKRCDSTRACKTLLTRVTDHTYTHLFPCVNRCICAEMRWAVWCSLQCHALYVEEI